MRKAAALLLALGMLLLTGCGFRSGEEFYALPRASDVYKSLEVCLQSLLDQGLEYSAPISGTNARSVQLLDLNGDGEDEAIGFFRDASGADSPLKIYFFQKDRDEKYQIVGHISGDGAAINSVVTCQFEKDSAAMSDLVVSWQVSSGVYALSAYSLSEYDGEFVISELMSSTSYTRYAIQDLDSDGSDELILLSLGASDTGTSIARYLDGEDDRLTERSSTPLSSSMFSIEKLHASTLTDGTPALYVTGITQNNSSDYAVTDILVLKKGKLINHTIDKDGHSSSITTRYNLAPDQDINGDGVWDIPIPSSLPAYSGDAKDTFYSVGWYDFNPKGEPFLLYNTYYNSTDGWYLDLPEAWKDHLTLARKDTNEGLTNERGIMFYYSENGSQPIPFLAVYKNTGSNQEARAELEGRMKLLSTQDATYSMELLQEGLGGVDANDLFNRFHLITTDWSAS